MQSTETNKYIQRACKTVRREALEGINTLCKAQHPPHDCIIECSPGPPPTPLQYRWTVLSVGEEVQQLWYKVELLLSESQVEDYQGELLLPLKLH